MAKSNTTGTMTSLSYQTTKQLRGGLSEKLYTRWVPCHQYNHLRFQKFIVTTRPTGLYLSSHTQEPETRRSQET